MDKQTWIEQIPFYLNGTLNDVEKHEFEQVLQQNPKWQVEIETWRVLADAVFHEAHDRSKKLPPISERVREALYPDRPSVAPRSLPRNGTHLHLVEPPPQNEESGAVEAQGGNNRRLTNAVGALVTLAATVAILFTAGILFLAFDGNDNGEETPPAVALAGTDESATQTIQAGAPQAPLGSPTAILPATATPLPPPLLPVSTATPNAVAGSGGGNPAAAQIVPEEGVGGGGGSAFDTQPFSSPSEDIAARGNCYVERQLGTSPIPIYQAANRASDVLGSMQPGQQLDTWIVTENGGDAFYQVFLPTSATRLGWVDSELVDLYGPDGNNCVNIVNPTPTNPAFQGGLPTPITDEMVCRVSSATGTSVRVYDIPSTSAPIIGVLNFGDLLIAREFYTGAPGWYRVILPGVGFGYLAGGDVNTNGNCAALPLTDEIALPTPLGATAVPARPTLSATACRVTTLNSETVTLYLSPSESVAAIDTLSEPMVSFGTWFVTRRTPQSNWYFLSELADERYQNRGWVLASAVRVEGACETQPAISATDWAATQQPRSLPAGTEDSFSDE